MDSLIKQYKQIISELLRQPILNFDDELSKKIPKQPGIYRIFESNNLNKAIYIGKSKSLQRRIIGDHYTGDRIASTLKRKLINGEDLSNEKEVKNYLSNNCLVQFLMIQDKDLLTSIEHFAVAVLKPKWND